MRLILASLACGAASAAIPVDLIGDTTCAWGDPACNVCAFDVERAFQGISDNDGDHTGTVAFRFEARDDLEDAGEPGFQPDLNDHEHIQGMGRLQGVEDENWFVFSRSTNYEDNGQPAGVFAAELGRFRSGGGHIGEHLDEDDELNQVQSYVTTEDDDAVGAMDPINHYGGMHALGSHVFVGGECYEQDVCADAPSRVDVFDFSDPSSPVLVSRLETTDPSDDVGFVGAARLASGRTLVMANFGAIYLSDDASDLRAATWSRVETWYESELVDEEPGQSGWPSTTQDFTVVTECETGTLYVVATNRYCSCFLVEESWCYWARSGCEDAMVLLRLEADAAGGLVVTKLASRHINCTWCDFRASGNAYVTREGAIVLYASSKEEDGGSGDVYVEEFQAAGNACNDLVDLGTDPEPGRELDADCDYGDHFDDDGDGYSEDAGDCDDADADAYPGGFDDDCDGRIDDADGDGTTGADGDCDDADATVFPGAPEEPDRVDDDCDGVLDEGTVTGDDDGDGYCEGLDVDADGVLDCVGSITGDCDDGDATAWPGAEEVADGADDDCDGAIDEGTSAGDDDRDGRSEDDGDCDDGDAFIGPDAPERANGHDDDCDGIIDERGCGSGSALVLLAVGGPILRRRYGLPKR